MKETKFSKDFLQRLNEIYPDMWFKKISGSTTQQTGIPDYLLCIVGKFISIEFKVQRDNKIRITPRQIKEINSIWDSKGIALLIAYDENRDKILIRQARLDSKTAMQTKKISIDWDFTLDSFEDAMQFMKNLIGNETAHLMGG